MTNHKSFRRLSEPALANPARRERIEAMSRAMADSIALAELRARRGLTQNAIATSMDVSQANISRIEHEEDLYLSTLRSYVAALGGELELTAVFPDGEVRLVAPGARG